MVGQLSCSTSQNNYSSCSMISSQSAQSSLSGRPGTPPDCGSACRSPAPPPSPPRGSAGPSSGWTDSHWTDDLRRGAVIWKISPNIFLVWIPDWVQSHLFLTCSSSVSVKLSLMPSPGSSCNDNVWMFDGSGTPPASPPPPTCPVSPPVSSSLSPCRPSSCSSDISLGTRSPGSSSALWSLVWCGVVWSAVVVTSLHNYTALLLATVGYAAQPLSYPHLNTPYQARVYTVQFTLYITIIQFTFCSIQFYTITIINDKNQYTIAKLNKMIKSKSYAITQHG